MAKRQSLPGELPRKLQTHRKHPWDAQPCTKILASFYIVFSYLQNVHTDTGVVLNLATKISTAGRCERQPPGETLVTGFSTTPVSVCTFWKPVSFFLTNFIFQNSSTKTLYRN